MTEKVPRLWCIGHGPLRPWQRKAELEQTMSAAGNLQEASPKATASSTLYSQIGQAKNLRSVAQLSTSSGRHRARKRSSTSNDTSIAAMTTETSLANLHK